MHDATVDTRRVANRRPVHFRTIENLLAEIDHVTAAAKVGKVRSLGNWSPAQVLWHVGRLVELSFDGFPFRYRRGPVWIAEAAVLEPEPSVSLDAAAAYLNQQLARIRDRERMTQQCSAEGTYSHEQWVYIHLRHAELHLSFLAVDDK